MVLCVAEELLKLKGSYGRNDRVYPQTEVLTQELVYCIKMRFYFQSQTNLEPNVMGAAVGARGAIVWISRAQVTP